MAGRKKSDPYESLGADFKSTVDNLSVEEIHMKIAQAALDGEAILAAKKNDKDLEEKKAAASAAGSIYRAKLKDTKLQIRYLRRALQDKGKASGDSGIEGADDDMPVDAV